MPIITRANLVTPPGRIKPRGELEINWAHPLAQGLRACFALNEQNNRQIDLTGRFEAKLTSPNFTVSREGLALRGDGTNNSATISKSFFATGGATGFKPFTLAAVARFLSTATQAAVTTTLSSTAGGEGAAIFYQGTSGSFQYQVKMTATTTARTCNVGSLTVGRIYTLLGVSWNATQTRLYVNGTNGGVTATGTLGNQTPNWNTSGLGVYVDSGGTILRLNGDLYLACAWDRGLKENEIALFNANPYAFLMPKRKFRMWTGAAGGVTNMVTASASFVLDATRTLLVQKNTTARLVLDASRTLQITKAVTARLNLAATKTFTLARSVTALLLLDATLVAQFVVVKSMTGVLMLTATESDVVSFQRSVSASLDMVATRRLEVAKNLSARLNLRATRTSTISKILTAPLVLAASLVELASFLVSASATLLLAATLNAQRVYVRSLTATLNLAATLTATYIPFAPGVASTVVERFKGMIANIGSFMRR